MVDLGPVSLHLEAELRELARQHGIVVWLDKEGAYTAFADALRARAEAGLFPYPVRGFRGSFLKALLELDALQDGVGMTPLVLHVPGHNEAEIAKTPLLELYAPGWRHRRKLPTLIKEAAHGAATVAEVEAFLAREGLTLQAADEWLAARSAGRNQLAGPDLSAHGAEALFDDLAGDGLLARQLKDPAIEAALWQRAELLLGIDAPFRARFVEDQGSIPPGVDLPRRSSSAANAALQLAAWALCVELVHDLNRAPKDDLLQPMVKLHKPAVHACQRLASHLRERHATGYAQLADEAEDHIPIEADKATAEDLGNIDTFRFEDRKVLEAALAALERGDHRAACDWARARIEGSSFWIKEKPERRKAWELVQLAADLGLALVEHARLLDGARTHVEAVERYARRGFAVDGAQRKLEQARRQASVLEIEEFNALRQRLDQLRIGYRSWADAQARAFNLLCAAQGFLPPASLRQRELFDEVVRPWAQDGGVTAYFMVDAMRFEMGEQLYRAIAGLHPAGVNLSARLAELPTVTEVGMNVLAPLSVAGKLRPEVDDGAISGFRSQEARVAKPEERRKVIHERAGGKTCPQLSLQDLLARDVTSLRKTIAEARLVIVHSEGIDKAGEKGVGLLVFEQELLELQRAYRLLHEAGVRRFVFTADHGFLLHDPVTRAPRLHGNKTVPKRRHVVSDVRLEQEGEVCVSASELEYDASDAYFLFPVDAAPFDLGNKAKDFVHGGNSLQERVIPVLTVQHKSAPGAEAIGYRIEVTAEKPVARMQCLRGRVTAASQTGLAFGSAAEVELVIECADSPDVTVELRDARDAKVDGNALIVVVDQQFEVFFVLHGAQEQRARVRMRHATGAKPVEPAEIAARFPVEVAVQEKDKAAAAAKPSVVSRAKRAPDQTWLEELPEGGVRDLFRHLDAHGTINEADATQLLGGPRQFRKFSRELDGYAAQLPFEVRVDISSGTKCYVKGGR